MSLIEMLPHLKISRLQTPDKVFSYFCAIFHFNLAVVVPKDEGGVEVARASLYDAGDVDGGPLLDEPLLQVILAIRGIQKILVFPIGENL